MSNVALLLHLKTQVTIPNSPAADRFAFITLDKKVDTVLYFLLHIGSKAADQL